MKEYVDIIKNCRRHDRQAQVKFYTLFSHKVFNSSFRILGDRMQAEEVMQESILKALTRTEMLHDEPGTMEAVLRRIAINHSIDICRRNRIEFVDLQPGYEKHQPADDPAEGTGEVTLSQIKTAIDRLPKGSRIILTLKLLDGLDYEEIAQVLRVSESAVRSQYSRARKKLAENLKTRTAL